MLSPSQIWYRTRTLSRDSLKLLQAVWKAPTATERRDALIQQATTTSSNDVGEPNQVAVNLLSFEKELNLVRYYGIPGYLKEKQYKLPFSTLGASSPSSSGAATSATPDSNSTNTEPKDTGDTKDSPPKVGKVAFMITSSMRQELTERLQYEPHQIKSLTPTDAMLILDNSVKPSDVKAQLPALQKEYEEARVLAAEEAAKQHAAEVEQKRRESELSSVIEESVSRSVPSDDEQGTTWYQVVECKDGEEPSVVGMYLDKAEAEFGQQTHQDLADKRVERDKYTDPEKPSTFEIRTVVKE